MQLISIPKFTVRWTEPLSGMRTREHALDANVLGESGRTPLRGHITAATKDQLGPLPGGGARAETHVIRDMDAAKAVEQIWKLVRRDQMEKWLTAVEPGERLGRNKLELVVERNGRTQAFRVNDLARAPQPVQDLLSAVASLHAQIRMHGEPRVWPPGPRG